MALLRLVFYGVSVYPPIRGRTAVEGRRGEMPAVQVQGEDDISVIMNRISCVVFVALVSLSCTSSDFVRRSVEERSLPEDSVAMDVRLARTVWKDAAWAGEYDRNIFQEYVLPPQVADEPVEFRWREDIPRWLSPDIGPEEDLITAARKINAAVDVPVKPETWGQSRFRGCRGRYTVSPVPL